MAKHYLDGRKQHTSQIIDRINNNVYRNYTVGDYSIDNRPILIVSKEERRHAPCQHISKIDKESKICEMTFDKTEHHDLDDVLMVIFNEIEGGLVLSRLEAYRPSVLIDKWKITQVKLVEPKVTRNKPSNDLPELDWLK